MKKMGRFVAVLVLLVAVAGLALAQEENLSEGRALGIGMQIGFPIGALISGRYWFTPEVGAEGIFFLWGDVGGFEGTVTTRFLYRVSDTPTVDFYTALGATFPFSSYGETDAIFSGVGGIEFSFPFAGSLSWNVEFGVALSTQGEVTMAIGTGLHFYFGAPAVVE